MKHHLIYVSAALFIMLGIFYWFEWRPTQIRKQCAWVQAFTQAVEARPSATEAELKERGMLRDCVIKQTGSYISVTTDTPGISNTCRYINQEIIDEYKSAKPAIPSKEYWREATNQEFESCIREQGLR